jgi:hypothetical protein
MIFRKRYNIKVGFEVLTAVSMKIAVFWVVAPCSLVEVYRRQQSSYNITVYMHLPLLQDSIQITYYFEKVITKINLIL